MRSRPRGLRGPTCWPKRNLERAESRTVRAWSWPVCDRAQGYRDRRGGCDRPCIAPATGLWSTLSPNLPPRCRLTAGGRQQTRPVVVKMGPKRPKCPTSASFAWGWTARQGSCLLLTTLAAEPICDCCALEDYVSLPLGVSCRRSHLHFGRSDHGTQGTRCLAGHRQGRHR